MGCKMIRPEALIGANGLIERSVRISELQHCLADCRPASRYGKLAVHQHVALSRRLRRDANDQYH
jgi:hypothetical protein